MESLLVMEFIGPPTEQRTKTAIRRQLVTDGKTRMEPPRHLATKTAILDRKRGLEGPTLVAKVACHNSDTMEELEGTLLRTSRQPMPHSSATCSNRCTTSTRTRSWMAVSSPDKTLTRKSWKIKRAQPSSASRSTDRRQLFSSSVPRTQEEEVQWVHKLRKRSQSGQTEQISE